MTRFRVAVTGIGVVSAIGLDIESFYTTLRSGVSGLEPLEFGGVRNDQPVSGGSVDDAAVAARLCARGIRPSTRMSRPSLMALLASSEALEMSALSGAGHDSSRVGVVMGKCQGQAMLMDGSRELIEAPLHAVGDWYAFNGPRVMISTACAASTNAIGLARDKLWSGEADAVIAGGTEELSLTTLRGFQAMQAVSANACAPYSRSDGLNLGEGAGFLVLEPLEAARRRGARILAEVLGYGLSADAYHPTAPDPVGRGAVSAMRRALRQAGVETGEISYVNGHGTGTPANDKMERNVMRTLFAKNDARVPISSTKSFVGHTLGAAGAVEAVACVLAIDRGFLPPTLGFDEPDVEFDFVPNEARDAHVSVAVSNNYAFGGNNASVVLAHPDRPFAAVATDAVEQPVVISGIGLVGSLGVGLPEWQVALEAGRTGVGRCEALGDGDAVTTVRPMPVLNGRGYAAPNEWRHMDALTQQGLVATRLALADAGLVLSKQDRADGALMFGTAFGPAGRGLEVDRQGGRGVSPHAFAQVTVNAAAGRICQVLSLRGPTTTFATGSVSGTVAFAAARDLVASGDAPFAIVVATDELFRELVQARAEEGTVPPDGSVRPYDSDHKGRVCGAAAVALVIESTDRAAARGVTPYCEVRSAYLGGGLAHHSVQSGQGSVARVIARALEKAGVRSDDIDYAVGCAGGYRADDLEAAALASSVGDDVAVSAPKALTGDCAAASGAVNLAVAALAVRRGAPAMAAMRVDGLGRHVLTNGDRPAVRTALALDIDLAGAMCAVVLGPCS
jgi:3-oxoacyl-[acyl-carrier-protein] synthase II